ncbi:hypothetical protein DRO54_10405 [Candidatus Bathyarchaeota archaeon]|nr:MAG: hypothetical protein DRO54_10405 [Candidatus Bathyarchaeota archaeon]
MATLEEKRRYFERWFRGWTARGYGSGQAYEEYMRVREYIPREYRIRKTDFLRLYREYAEMEERHAKLRSVRKDYIPSERLYTPKSLYTGRRYHTILKFEGYDKTTGEKITAFYTFTHDRLMKRGELEKEALEWIKNIEGGSPKEWKKATVWEGFRNINVP